MSQLDIQLFYLINHFRNSFLDSILPIFSNTKFIDTFYILVSFFLLIKYSFRKYLIIFLFMVLGFVIADFSCAKILKPYFKKERPFVSLPKIYYYSNGNFEFLSQPKNKKNTLSFPSCHAGNSSFLSFFLSFFYLRLALILFPFFILVGWSRIYLGVHFPFDVLGGWLFGFILAFIFFKLCKRVYVKFDAK
uniref:Phosphatase PAP2 family protein n=1 Tax=Thermodesulfobacterium geofontis TaxID=1295609 RepID=A0A7V4N466_9BACT